MRLNPFVAASVALGFAALSAFRPWWVPKKHQQTARLAYAGATGVLLPPRRQIESTPR